LLLELLRRERIPAAFFFVGEAARRYPALVARAAADGHLIGNHSDRHGYGWTISSTERLFAEFAAANRTLAAILGQPPRFARTPAGVSRPNLAEVFQQLQLRNVAWDVRGLEGLYRDPGRIAARVARRARNGSIILLHELYYGVLRFEPRQVLATAQRTIQQLRSRGFRFARLDRLLEQSDLAGLSDEESALPGSDALLAGNDANESMGDRRAAPRTGRAP
jgi:peptidoglycan/xylan/chitin deacetylase (PgdA/CDA1 family)